MRGGLTRRMLVASALLALLVGAAFAVLLLAIGDLRGSARVARHSAEVIGTAHNLEKLVLDLETGQRGYVITGDERYLEPWRSARSAFPSEAMHLQNLVRDDREQEERARAIADQGASYLREYSLPLVRAARVDRSRARALVARGEGKRRVDAIRNLFTELTGVEETLGAIRDRNADSAAERAITAAVGGLAGSLLLILLFAGYLTRAIVSPVRRVATAASQLAGGDLSTRLPEGGGAEIGELGRTFNVMAGSLQESRDELESQNAELELQTAELEDQQTELARVNDELEARQPQLERARLLLESTGEGIYGIDLEGRCTFINQAGARTLGYEPSEVIGLNMHELVHHTRADGSPYPVEDCPILQAVTHGRPCQLDNEILWRRDGSSLRVQYGSHPVVEDDEISGAVITFLDITDRARAEEERAQALAQLARERDRLEALFQFGERLSTERELQPLAETVLAGLCDLGDAELGVLYVSDEHAEGKLALTAVRGFDRAALPIHLVEGVGMPGRALAEDRTVLVSHGEAGLPIDVFGRKAHVCHELHVPLSQADRRLGLITLARLADRPFTRDELASIEHLADQAAVALSNALSFREARHLAHINRAVLDATADAIRLVDIEGNTLVTNAAMERAVGDLLALPEEGTIYERVVSIGTRTTDPGAYQAAMDAIAADPAYEGVHEYQFADTGRWVQRYTVPVYGSEGALIGRLFVIREVTTEREAERLKTELVATVSHELRTPLASVLGFAELLFERDVDAETQKRYLGTIHNEAQRLTDLINDFLDLQRIEEGRFTLSVESFELGDLLAEEVALFSGQSAQHDLVLERPTDGLTVVGEPNRIRQVVGNLLSNAIKYSPAGGPVGVAADQVDGHVRIRIADSGLGIPADQQRQIFEKFFRVDTSDTRTIGGTGLGLALCREIVERHGGRIGFESAEGEGSTFWFELPAGARPGRDGNGSVLLIEDDPGVVKFLSAVVTGEGYGVEVSASGEEGLARAEANPPALICLDIALAGELDGWEVLERLKANPATADVPVLVCTAGNGHNRAASLGAADFLTKPFSPQHLRDTLARLIPEKAESLLVVDDEPGIRRLVVESLAGEGLEVWEAENGVEALALVAERKPDAIVLDLVMPELDGFSVLERLRADPKTRLIPIVVLTAKNLTTEERNALQVRAVSLLAKSDYSAEELRSLVRQALGTAALTAAVGS